jgi:CrcB protein
MTIAYIALGGLAGTLARFWMQGLVQGRFGDGTFPIGTLVVNVTGSLLLGFLLRYATGTTVIPPDVRAGLTFGFLGAFTTMSTFAYETVALVNAGDFWRAGLYMSLSALGCPLGAFAGIAWANRLL